MPAALNIFTQEPFDMMSVTRALDKMPYRERMLGSMGLFETEFLDTTVVEIDEQDGQIQILSTRERGAPAERKAADPKRKARLLKVPHMAYEERIMASQIQNDRATGQIVLSSAVQKVNNAIQKMRQDVENTYEIHRLGALKGNLLDADGSVIYNYFDEFEVTQETGDMLLDTTSTDVRNTIVGLKEAVEDNLGAAAYTGMMAICGRSFFKKLIGHPNVEKAYENYQAAQSVLPADLRSGFEFGDVSWVQYRGMRNLTADIGVVPDDKAYLFPLGVDGMFRVAYAPGDFMDMVNMAGTEPWIAKVAPDMKWNKHVDVLIETDPLFHNTRPNAVIELFENAAP